MPNKYKGYGGAVYGRCRLCGRDGPLDFEHIPPRSCGNSTKISLPIFEVGLLTGEPVVFDKGMGVYGLCSRCNGWTGSEYNEFFGRWTTAGQGAVSAASGGYANIEGDFNTLRIAKQVLTWVIALGDEDSWDSEYRAELRELVLEPARPAAIPPCEIRCYAVRPGDRRLASACGAHPVQITGRSEVPFVRRHFTVVLAEAALPPIGYLVTVNPPDTEPMPTMNKLADISSWLARPDASMRESLRLPFKRTLTPFPLDYRTVAQLERDVARQRPLRRRNGLLRARFCDMGVSVDERTPAISYMVASMDYDPQMPLLRKRLRSRAEAEDLIVAMGHPAFRLCRTPNAKLPFGVVAGETEAAVAVAVQDMNWEVLAGSHRPSKTK